MRLPLFVWPALLATLAPCSMTAAVAQTPAAPAAAPAAALEASDDGATVLDRRSKLAWARCVEGMHWNGSTCTGQRQLLDRSQASAQATARAKAEGLRWRLPRANELRRLVDKRADPPGLPPLLFPAAPPGLHWTGTANIKHYANNPYNYGTIAQGSGNQTSSRLAALEGWAVDMETGEASGDIARSTRLPVRLVRPQD